MVFGFVRHPFYTPEESAQVNRVNVSPVGRNHRRPGIDLPDGQKFCPRDMKERRASWLN
jgi:hypothetical protein